MTIRVEFLLKVRSVTVKVINVTTLDLNVRRRLRVAQPLVHPGARLTQAPSPRRRAPSPRPRSPSAPPSEAAPEPPPRWTGRSPRTATDPTEPSRVRASRGRTPSDATAPWRRPDPRPAASRASRDRGGVLARSLQRGGEVQRRLSPQVVHRLVLRGVQTPQTLQVTNRLLVLGPRQRQLAAREQLVPLVLELPRLVEHRRRLARCQLTGLSKLTSSATNSSATVSFPVNFARAAKTAAAPGWSSPTYPCLGCRASFRVTRDTSPGTASLNDVSSASGRVPHPSVNSRGSPSASRVSNTGSSSEKPLKPEGRTRTEKCARHAQSCTGQSAGNSPAPSFSLRLNTTPSPKRSARGPWTPAPTQTPPPGGDAGGGHAAVADHDVFEVRPGLAPHHASLAHPHGVHRGGEGRGQRPVPADAPDARPRREHGGRVRSLLVWFISRARAADELEDDLERRPRALPTLALPRHRLVHDGVWREVVVLVLPRPSSRPVRSCPSRVDSYPSRVARRRTDSTSSQTSSSKSTPRGHGRARGWRYAYVGWTRTTHRSPMDMDASASSRP